MTIRSFSSLYCHSGYMLGMPLHVDIPIPAESPFDPIAARNAALVDASNLGPPDLCVMTKAVQQQAGALMSSLLSSGEEANEEKHLSSYHYVLGLDVSSPAPVASYVADLAAEFRPTSWLATAERAAHSAVYCSWDLFKRVDLRVRVSIPGGVQASIVAPDGRGGVVELHADESAWQRVALSGLMRALCPPPPGLPGLHVLPPPLSPQEEAPFLASIRDWLLVTLEPSSQLTSATAGIDQGATDVSAELLSSAVYQHFAHSFRFEQAVLFFLPLAGEIPACAECAAAAQRELGQLPDAILTVGEAIDALAGSGSKLGSLLITQGELLLQCHMLEPALRVASHAVSLAPLHWRAWTLLTSALLANGRHVDALRTLNTTPVYALSEPLLAAAHPLPMPALSSTAPALGAVASSSSASLAAVAVALAAATVPSQPQSSEPGAAAPNAAEAFATAAYAILAELTQSIGWERVVQVRAAAFVMVDAEGPDAIEGAVAGARVAGTAVAGATTKEQESRTSGTDPATPTARGTSVSRDADAQSTPGAREQGPAWPDGTDGPLASTVAADESGSIGELTRDCPWGGAACDTSRTRWPLESSPATPRGRPGVGHTPTPLCHAWLDALFQQLHADLDEMETWRDDVRGSAALAAAAGGRGARDAHELWLSRARLAQRLLSPTEARAAYTHCVQALEALIDGTDEQAPVEGSARDAAEILWTEACMTLMRLHADGSEGTSVREALAAAHRLLDECAPQLAAASAAARAPAAPREITACIYRLTSLHGLQHVRSEQRAIGDIHPALNDIFHEVVLWKVNGYDR